MVAGRWHVPLLEGGRAVVYTAGTRALAQLEKRVHCNGFQPADQALVRLELPDGAPLLDAERDLHLPAGWRDDETVTQALGDAWFASKRSLGLWVPSFVEPREQNLLLHPLHPRYAEVKVIVEVADFRFDPRLFARGAT